MPRSLRQQKVTWALYDRIVAMGDGLIDKEIAKECGCSISTVERARKEAGQKKKPPYKGFSSKMTPAVREWLRKNYLKTNDTKIAKRFGIAESTASHWRIKLGLRYPHTSQWRRYPHPKGMEGKKHSPQLKEASRLTSLKMWADPNHYLNSEVYKQKVSDRMSKVSRTKTKENVYSSAKRGYREDLGKVFFRSRWEANYARYLNLLKARGEIFDWQFEADTFWFEKIKRGVRSYCPDFKIWQTEQSAPYYVEVKGWMDPKSKTKLKRMAKYYPAVRVDVFGEKEYRTLEKSLAALIPGWEKKTAA